MLVAPHVGAWIEICNLIWSVERRTVAPHVGAWIEILCLHAGLTTTGVAPHVGAWIEMCRGFICFMLMISRSPRGSVD